LSKKVIDFCLMKGPQTEGIVLLNSHLNQV